MGRCRTIRRSVAAIALAVFAPLASLAQQPAPRPAELTLAAAVDRALASRPAVDAANARQAAADARVDEAHADRLPRLSAGERVTNGNNPVYVFGTLLEQGRFTAENFGLDALNNPDPVTNFRSEVDVQVPVFDQLQASTRIRRAELGRERADAERRMTEMNIRHDVVRAYVAVLVARAADGVASDAVTSAEADAKRARDRVEAGLVVASDLLAVEVQLADFRRQKLQAEGDLASAIAALNVAMGAPIETQWSLPSDPIRSLPALPDLGEARRTALARRPDLASLDLAVREGEQAVRGARGEYLPRVDAFASIGHSAEALVGGSGDYAAGVAVSFTIFDAGRRARVDAARAERDAAAAERAERANAAELEVVRAYQDVVTAVAQAGVTAKAVAQADETLRIVRNRYDAGITTVTEVLRSQTALVRARLNDVESRYAATVGYSRLLLVSGALDGVAPLVR